MADTPARRPRSLTDSELHAAYATALATVEAAWAAWARVRDAGETSLHCVEWQAHNAARRVSDPLGTEIYRREQQANLQRLFSLTREPFSGPDWDRAWHEGPGRDAL